jgi:hypothetical protein
MTIVQESPIAKRKFFPAILGISTEEPAEPFLSDFHRIVARGTARPNPLRHPLAEVFRKLTLNFRAWKVVEPG